MSCLKGLLKQSILQGLTEMIRAATNENHIRSHSTQVNKTLSTFPSADLARIHQ